MRRCCRQESSSSERTPLYQETRTPRPAVSPGLSCGLNREHEYRFTTALCCRVPTVCLSEVKATLMADQRHEIQYEWRAFTNGCRITAVRSPHFPACTHPRFVNSRRGKLPPRLQCRTISDPLRRQRSPGCCLRVCSNPWLHWDRRSGSPPLGLACRCSCSPLRKISE